MVFTIVQVNSAEKGLKIIFYYRWYNHLDPKISKHIWTEKEEEILFMKHLEFGNKWSEIANCLPGRY